MVVVYENNIDDIVDSEGTFSKTSDNYKSRFWACFNKL